MQSRGQARRQRGLVEWEGRFVEEGWGALVVRVVRVVDG